MGFLRFIVLILVIIGAINWGLWGVIKYDFIAHITGSNTAFFARTIYVIIGLAGIWAISFIFCPSFYNCSTKKKDIQK